MTKMPREKGSGVVGKAKGDEGGVLGIYSGVYTRAGLYALRRPISSIKLGSVPFPSKLSQVGAARDVCM